MPTVIRESGYRIAFFSADAGEPPHVHVSRESKEAKFWMRPFVRLARNKGFRPQEINEIERILTEKQDIVLEAWNAHFRR